jgi:negative regulator of sigma E activity
MLAELNPAPVRTELTERIGQSIEQIPATESEPRLTMTVDRWFNAPAFRGAMAACVLAAVSLGLILSGETNTPTPTAPTVAQAPNPNDYQNLTGAPTLLAYHQAMRQSPEAFLELLDQPRRQSTQEPLSLRSDLIDIE